MSELVHCHAHAALGRLAQFALRPAHRALACGAIVLAITAASCGESPTSSAPASDARGVTHVRIEGELDVGTLGELKRAIQEAERAGNDHLVVEIDTPGGAIDLMWQVSKLLRDAASKGVVPVAWVHDHALSAGVLVALSCDRIYMAPQASIGSAMPVRSGLQGIEALPREEGVREKVTSALRGNFRAMAEKQGRPAALAEAMVDADAGAYQVKDDNGLHVITGQEWDDARTAGHPPELVRTIARRGELVNLSASQAVELAFADGLAENLHQLLQGIGRGDAALSTVERARSDDVLTWLDRLAPWLIIAGLVLAYLELKVPGFGLAGILSIACFAVLLTGRYLAGLADVPDIVAVALGVLLIATEIFVFPGTLWLGIAGAILVLGGFIFGSIGPGFEWRNVLDRNLVIDAAFRFMMSAVTALVAMLALSRFLPKTPMLRALVLDPNAGAAVPAFAGALPEAHAPAVSLGARGIALTALRPVGKVRLDAEAKLEYEARAVGRLIERGEHVHVVEVNAGRLVVEAEEADEAGEKSR
jgi:membrane-bound serine protease (ClpP class)